MCWMKLADLRKFQQNAGTQIMFAWDSEFEAELCVWQYDSYISRFSVLFFVCSMAIAIFWEHAAYVVSKRLETMAT